MAALSADNPVGIGDGVTVRDAVIPPVEQWCHGGSAADKAHNAGDMVLDARRDPAMWRKFNAGLDGSSWYLLRMHQALVDRLSESRSVERLGEAVGEILSSSAYQQLIPSGSTAMEWALSYPERHRP